MAKAVLWGGLLCGGLDISAAFVDARYNYDIAPVRVLQGVASALLGPAALEGGLATAVLGLVMHFLVAFAATAVFYLLCRRFPLLLRWVVPSGLAYGAVVYFVMYRGVIPLTIELKSLYLTTGSPAWPRLRWQSFAVHLFCVGLPIAVMVRRFGPRKTSRSKV